MLMGEQQSPINVRRAVKAAVDFEVCWHEGRFEAERAAHGHRLRPVDAHWVKLDGERFELANVHFHRPSEHWVSGRRFDAELHAVHVRADDGLKVVAVAVLLNLGERDGAQPAEPPTTLDLPALLPRGGFYRYEGSLTTPDFGENVSWVVMRDPVTPRDPLRGFVLAHGDQARDPQPLHRRFVLASG
ncbi:carbonic anhydrase family protein [Saccharothrix mutabilis subsp. mutabilis]|uniref:Carbonic anhydrase n=2 Tax=Saccharothrix mutabilis TaxID=33921 RepID=A0ABN0USJ1_9PSEU